MVKQKERGVKINSKLVKSGLFVLMMIVITGVFFLVNEKERTITVSSVTGFVVAESTDSVVVREVEASESMKVIAVTSVAEAKIIVSLNEARSELVEVYEVRDGSRVGVGDLDFADGDNDGLVESVSWIAPASEGESVYEIIIEITEAAHLDENRRVMADIYEEVRALDEVWSEPIYH